MNEVTCLQCGVKKLIRPCRIKTFKFCSKSCQATYMFKGKLRPNISKALKGRKRPEMSKIMKGRIHTWGDKISRSKIGKSYPKHIEAMKNRIAPSNETKRKISESQRGRIPWNKGLTKEIDEIDEEKI